MDEATRHRARATARVCDRTNTHAVLPGCRERASATPSSSSAAAAAPLSLDLRTANFDRTASTLAFQLHDRD